jgi:hypothetical protein
MNKFMQLISSNGNETLNRRASSIATTAEIKQQNLVNSLKSKREELKLDIANLTDLAPDSTDSLRPGSKDWNPETWVEQLQSKKEELYSIEISLKIAQETYDEYFREKSE